VAIWYFCGHFGIFAVILACCIKKNWATLDQIPNGHKIHQHLPFKGPQKFTQIWDLGFENKPSGNPALNYKHTQKKSRKIPSSL
jgi:hypothetical protein